MLPTTIKGALQSPNIADVVRESGKETVLLLIEFEIVKLATSVNVGGNLTGEQAKDLAADLLELYPMENIADFRACFHRAVMQRAYGDIYRLDAMVIAGWMSQYIEEKYQELENEVYRQKDQPYEAPKRLAFESFSEFPEKGTSGVTYFDKEKGNAYQWSNEEQKYLPQLNLVEEFNKMHGTIGQPIRPMTRGEIHRMGQEQPPARIAASWPISQQAQYDLRAAESAKFKEQWLKEMRAKYPGLSDEQLNTMVE